MSLSQEIDQMYSTALGVYTGLAPLQHANVTIISYKID